MSHNNQLEAAGDVVARTGEGVEADGGCRHNVGGRGDGASLVDGGAVPSGDGRDGAFSCTEGKCLSRERKDVASPGDRGGTACLPLRSSWGQNSPGDGGGTLCLPWTKGMTHFVGDHEGRAPLPRIKRELPVYQRKGGTARPIPGIR